MADESIAPPPPPQPSQAVTAPRTEPLAIFGLLLAIASWFFCLLLGSVPAIICGHLARSKIRRSNGLLGGMNLTVAALIIAYLEIPFGVLGGIMLVDMIRSERVRLHDLAFEQKEITSDDGKSKITASGFWVKRSDLNQRASVQAAYKDKEMYAMVISEPKSTVPNMTLEQHHQLTRDHMLQKMKDSSGTQPVSVTIDDHPALQDELSGTDNGANIVFLHTTVDAGDDYHQILAWTLKSRWSAHNAELRDVTNSFHTER